MTMVRREYFVISLEDEELDNGTVRCSIVLSDDGTPRLFSSRDEAKRFLDYNKTTIDREFDFDEVKIIESELVLNYPS